MTLEYAIYGMAPAINWQELFYGNNHLTRNNNVVTIELNGGAIMEKTATLNLRVNPTLKQDAESYWSV